MKVQHVKYNTKIQPGNTTHHLFFIFLQHAYNINMFIQHKQYNTPYNTPHNMKKYITGKKYNTKTFSFCFFR